MTLTWEEFERQGLEEMGMPKEVLCAIVLLISSICLLPTCALLDTTFTSGLKFVRMLLRISESGTS
jgi:hypothetical protein